MSKEFFEKYPTYLDYSKNYLGAWSFENGDETLTIRDIDQAEVFDPETNTQKMKLVLYFEEKRLPMVFETKENQKIVAEVLGTADWSKWIGRKIIVGKSKVRAFGKLTEAIRVRDRKPDTETFICERCGQIVTPASGRSAAQLVDIAKRNTGKILCLDCMKAVKAEQEAQE